MEESPTEMERRYFDFLYTEISTALGERVSRYDLWLAVWNSGGDPDDLTHTQVQSFLETGLARLLREEGKTLQPRACRRLSRRLLAFDPRFPTPEERIAVESIHESDAA